MKAARCVFAVLMLAVFSMQVFAQGVTEDDARAILANVDRAIPLKDFEVIAAALSDDVVIEANIAMGGQSQAYTYRKAEYLQGLRDSWAQTSEYEYKRDNQSIVVSGGTATVSADVVESMVIQGQAFTSKSREVATIERVDGVPLITRIVADATVDAVPR